jgi:hypothetical protein
LEALKSLPSPIREWNKPLRVTIDSAYKITGVGTVITGTVIQGVIHDGQYVKIGPINKIVRIRSLHLAVPKYPIKEGYPGDYVGINVSGIHANECSCRRLGMITGFLPMKEREKHIRNDPEVAYREVRPQSFLCEEACITEEERKLAELRKREAPLHPCKSFTAYITFDNMPKDTTVHLGQQLTMHCHNSQVQIDLVKSKWLPRFHNREELRQDKDKALAETQPDTPFSTLPREILYFIWQMLPQGQVFSTMPQLSKDFLSLATDRLYWQAINKRDAVNYVPIHPRNAWIIGNLTKDNQEMTIQRGQAVLAEIRPRGRPVGLDTYFSCETLGRFLIRIGQDIVGTGKVLDTSLSGELVESYLTC